eukprot:2963684-Pyramimonas_sp.AAC.1
MASKRARNNLLRTSIALCSVVAMRNLTSCGIRHFIAISPAAVSAILLPSTIHDGIACSLACPPDQK